MQLVACSVAASTAAAVLPSPHVPALREWPAGSAPSQTSPMGRSESWRTAPPAAAVQPAPGQGAAAAAGLVGSGAAGGAGPRQPGAGRDWRDRVRQDHPGGCTCQCLHALVLACHGPLPEARSPHPNAPPRLHLCLSAACLAARRSLASCTMPASPRAEQSPAPSRAAWRR